MTRAQRYRYEMFGRVDDFGTANVELFPAASKGGQMFAEVRAAVTAIEEHLKGRDLARAEARRVKATTRAAVTSYMKVIAATARRVTLEEPGPSPFRSSRTTTNAALLTKARLFIDEAKTREARFVEFGMPPTFISDFTTLVDQLAEALAAVADSSSSALRFSTVALWWLKGLLCLARGAEDEAMTAFEKELAQEALGHIYSRECCAQVWYAKGVCAIRRGDAQAARFACGEGLARVPRHPTALAMLAILDGRLAPFAWPGPGPAPIDVAQAQAALLKAGGYVSDAAALLVKGLDQAPPGNGGWLIPIEPLLSVQQDKAPWAQALMTLRTRAGTWVAAG